MTITALIAVLTAASSWTMPCTQTSVQNGSYNRVQQYTLDAIHFEKSGSDLSATFTREWHKDAACADTAYDVEKTETTVTLAEVKLANDSGFFKPMQPMQPMPGMQPLEPMNPIEFSKPANAETVFDADFKHKDSAIVELGRLSLSGDQKTVKVARSFGTVRNTMLSFGYTAQK